MSWVMISVALAVAGLVVLAACAVKVFVALGELGRELDKARSRLEPKQAELQRELARSEHMRG